MFRWCSFCQKFLGESEPKNDYTSTHGLCHRCKAKPYSEEDISNIKSLRDFIKDLFEIPKNFRELDIEPLVRKGKLLNARASDLFIGITQAVLLELAENEKAGKKPFMSLEEFNDFIDKTSAYIKAIYNLNPTPHGKPIDILLTLANGNYNYPATKFMEIALSQETLSIHIPHKILSMKEVSELSKTHHPKVIAVTVQDPNDLDRVLKESEHLKSLPSNPLIIFGGAGINFCKNIPKHIQAYDGNMEMLLETIRSHVSKRLATV